MAQRSRKLEHRDSVFLLKPSGDHTIAQKGSVAGRIALDRTFSKHRRIVVDRYAGLRLGHGTHIAGKAELLCHIDVVLRRMLVEQHGNIGGRCFSAQAFQGRKAHHDRSHLILIHKDHFVGKRFIISDSAVSPEQIVQQFRHVNDDQILLRMAHPQVFPAKALGMPVHHHGDRQIFRHPAIPQHSFDIARNSDKFTQCKHDPKPAGIIVEGIFHASPLAALSDLSPELVEIPVSHISPDLLRVYHFLSLFDSHRLSSCRKLPARDPPVL